MKDLATWLIAINVLAILAAIYPCDLGAQADVLKPAPLGIHPEWYFMSQFQVLKIIGKVVPGMAGEILGLIIFTVAMLGWFAIPLYDPDSKSGRRARRATWFGLVLLIGMVVTTLWGYLAL
jgi:quinol-cytochrome oxidoreductase complex cytochrome b subunit